MVPVVLGATIAVFAMVRALPGDPAVIMLGNKATPEQIEALQEKMGLNEPLVIQYLYFLRDLLTGDMGVSVSLNAPVTTLIGEKLEPTLLLVSMTVIITLALAIPLSVLAATRRDRLADHGVRVGTTLAFGMPQFWLGLLLVLVFSVNLPLFPVAGYGQTFAEHVWHMILPSLTLAIGMTAILIRPLRADIIRLQQSEFVEVARAKGVRGSRLMTRHVLRNAMVTIVTILGVRVGWLIGGTVVVESVFSIPGLGWLLLRGVTSRDYAIIQGLTVVFVLGVVLINLLTDVLYTFLDPRVRFD